MFINANPRYVSNGCFNTFVVPFQQRVESAPYRRLVEMTNNNINAWSVFGPVSATTTEAWDDQGVDFSGDENFNSQSMYGRQYQETYSTVQQQTFSFPKTAAYATVNQGQTNMRPYTSQRTFQAQAPSLNCIDNSPMLGSDYAQWSLGRGRGSFAEFSKTPNVSKDLQYQSLDDMRATSFASNSTVPASMSSYTTTAPVPIGDSFSIDRTSPSTAYSSYSSTNTSVEPNNLMALETLTMDTDLRKNDWWQNVPRNCADQFHTDFDAMLVHDGLPRYQIPQNNAWNLGPNPCSSEPMPPYTVPPKDTLTLEVPLAMSTSGSSQGTVPDSSDSSTGYSSRDNTADYSGSERMSFVERPIRRNRHLLPTEPEAAQRDLSVGSSNDAQSKHNRKSPPKTKSFTKSTLEFDDSYSPPSSKKHRVPALKLLTPKKIEPKPAPTEEGMHHRSKLDDFLIDSKRSGMSYKEIRRRGGFTEAESTLRGRFRTLTKHKTARVRKPEWNDNDIRLLRKAVRKLSDETEVAKGKIPWKLVAEYIANNGGSYHFGNATCRKRWDELQSNRRMST